MTTPTIPRLHDQLRAAERAATEPRQRVAALETALQAAIADHRFGDAERIKADLQSAREAAAIADAQVAAFRTAAAQLDQQQAEESRAADEARRHEQANQMLDRAVAAVERGRGQRTRALQAMRAAIADAQSHFRAAQAAEEQINAARQQEIEARRLMGAYGSDPGPKAARENATAVLIDSDPLVRALAAWQR